MALRLSTGLRDMMLGLQATISAVCAGAGQTLTIVDGAGGADTITRAAGSFVTDGFVAGDKVTLSGATTGANDTAFTGVLIDTVAALTLTFETGVVDTGEVFAAATVLAAATGGCVKDIFRNGILYIYSGSQPATADTAASGTNLVKITDASGAWTAGAEANGLEFGDYSAGTLSKCADQTWSGVGIGGGGTAGWFRLCANPTDAGALSTVLPRIDGSIGTSGANLNMSSTTIVDDATYTIDTFTFTLPLQYGS